MFHTLILALCLFTVLTLWRFYCTLPNAKTRAAGKSLSTETKSLAIFLGSGGHTSEAIALLSALDFNKYTPRTYLLSEGDHLSAEKAKELEAEKSSHTEQFAIITVPRARKVHQSLLSTPPTACRSLVTCISLITIKPIFVRSSSKGPFADVLLLNGPGTCLILCLAVYLNKFLGLHAPRIIYVESFARVKSLSLSGKLLRSLVDRFIVQWPDILADGRKGECRGWLV
ncbi:glycosyltransferase family 1 protein [Hymenopellis radicata]|nr:glycosyltransferase family 1 protein [Hymenopellis radicata]